VAGDDLDSSLIMPLIKRAEPEGAGGSSALSWPEGDTPTAEELAGPQLPGELIAAVPSRDMLAVTGSQVPGGIAADWARGWFSRYFVARLPSSAAPMATCALAFPVTRDSGRPLNRWMSRHALSSLSEGSATPQG
jgi:hypothetical protein